VALIDEIGAGPVGIDTSVFIYFIEGDERFMATVVPLFGAADIGKCELVVSALTLLEVLVVPYRAGNPRLAERYEALLTRSRGVRMVDVSRDHLRAAAQLRATTGVATPDAIQLATALGTGCSHFVTNDRRLPTVQGLKIVQLGNYSA
jgi:predicted nucleic acid-binding protein